MTERCEEGRSRCVGIADLNTECALPYGVQEGRGGYRGSDAVVEAKPEEACGSEDKAGVTGVLSVKFGQAG